MKNIIGCISVTVFSLLAGIAFSLCHHDIRLGKAESMSAEQFCLLVESSIHWRVTVVREIIASVQQNDEHTTDYTQLLEWLENDIENSEKFAEHFCVWSDKEREKPWPLFFDPALKRFLIVKHGFPIFMSDTDVLAMIVPEMSASELRFFEDVKHGVCTSIIDEQTTIHDSVNALAMGELKLNDENARMNLASERDCQSKFIDRWKKTIACRWTTMNDRTDNMVADNTAANELFSLSELPDGVVGDLARMFRSPDEDEVWRDYCLQFLGSALEREDGVTDEDRALARKTLVEALASTNATFAGTALRALHRGDPADPLVASNALRIARDSSYPSSSRTTALLILEDCVRATPSTASTLTETASAISSDPSASSLLRRTAEAVQKRSSVQSHDQWNDQGGSR